MPLRYKPAQQLECEHQDTITALAFSPKGSFLAITSLDGILSIWSTKTWKTHYTVATGGVGFLSLLWTSNAEDVQLTNLAVTVTGFRAHSNLPVECLAIDGATVATGASSEVSLWHYDKVVGGSMSGQVHIWDCKTRQLLQTLDDPDHRPVVSIGAYYVGSFDGPKFVLATGTLCEQGIKPWVTIWRPVAEGDHTADSPVGGETGTWDWVNASAVKAFCMLLAVALAYAAGSIYGLPAKHVGENH